MGDILVECMMTTLDKVKASFNPYNLHGIWGHNGVDPDLGTSFGPLVIAKDGAVPVVRSQLISGEVRIEGDVHIGKNATVRRQTTIYGTKEYPTRLHEYALLMDYCVVEEGVTIDFGAGFAHAGITRHAHFGAHSFGNIEIHAIGTPSKPITIQEGAYLGPGLWVPAGGTVDANAYYIGHDPAFILPNVHLDPQTFQRTGLSVKQGKVQNEDRPPIIRPIALTDAELDLAEKGELSREDLLHFWRLDRRPYKETPFGDYDITDLAKLNVDEWIAAQNRRNVHRPALANWLWYYPMVQHLKQISYVHEDAKQHGDIVFQNAIMQSDILQLDRLHRALSSMLAPELIGWGVEQLVKSKLYLLGAYQPKNDAELQLMDSAYRSAPIILERAMKAIAGHEQDISITTQRRATIDNALKLAGGDRIHVRLGKQEKLDLLNVLQDVLERETEVQKKLSYTQPTTNVKPIQLPQADVPQWLHDINPNRINFATLSDGPQVRGFGGHVPVIEDDVTLVGKVDISGAVHIGGGVTLEEGSYRSEQTTAPVFIGGKVYIKGAITHTATKEKYPVHINGDAGPIVVLGGHIHGAHILPDTYAVNALLSDEGRVQGVVAEHTMNVGEKQASKNGEVPLIGGSFSVNVLERKNDGSLTYPHRFDEYKAWWDKSEFKDIPLSELGANDNEIKARIEKIYHQRVDGAALQLEEKVEKYGALYKHSAQFQAAVLQLRHASRILDQQDEPALATQLERMAKAYEVILGVRDEPLPVVALWLKQGTARMDAAALALNQIAARGEVLSIPDWQHGNSPYGLNYEDAEAIGKGAHRPVTENARRNFEMANRLSENPDVDHVIEAAHVLKEGLRANIDVFPKGLNLLAKQLQRLPQQMAALNEQAELAKTQPKQRVLEAPKRALAAG